MKKFIDLFTGVGGFHLAFTDSAECVYAAEWNDDARKTYDLNFRPNGNEFDYGKDISALDIDDIPAHDILCAGFPCQPFSIAGSREGFAHKTQGTLFYDLLRIMDLHKPSVIFLENVKNLQSHDGGKTFEIIEKELKNLGYFIKYKILNACAHGDVPQNRERIFIVGFRNKEQCRGFEFPEEIPLKKQIPDMLIDETDKKLDDIFYQTNMESPSVIMMHDGIKKDGTQGPFVEHLNTIYQYRRYYIRENKRGVCPTLTANMGTGGHNVPLIRTQYGIRKLTPRECFNFQGYPTDFKLPKISNSHLYKQAGNSIPYPVVKRIAQNIMSSFNPDTWEEMPFAF